MNDKITTVMYHYVREIKNSKYPEIKGLEFSSFKKQLDFFEKNYNIINPIDIINCNQLPENSLLLTFDDGYKDMYKYVFPELKKRNLSGIFFPVVDSSVNLKMLYVNKIHFILACVKDKNIIIDEIKSYLNMNNIICEFDIPSSRFDTQEVMYIKTILQKELESTFRNELIDILFKQFVTHDEAEFAQSLYCNENELKEMYENNMLIGAHGYSHVWLNKLAYADQKFEMEQSINFLNKLGVNNNELTISYPFGGYNEDTLKLASELKFQLGFTTKVDYSYTNDNLELSRFDTNDFPK